MVLSSKNWSGTPRLKATHDSSDVSAVCWLTALSSTEGFHYCANKCPSPGGPHQATIVPSVRHRLALPAPVRQIQSHGACSFVSGFFHNVREGLPRSLETFTSLLLLRSVFSADGPHPFSSWWVFGRLPVPGHSEWSCPWAELGVSALCGPGFTLLLCKYLGWKCWSKARDVADFIRNCQTSFPAGNGHGAQSHLVVWGTWPLLVKSSWFFFHCISLMTDGLEHCVEWAFIYFPL